MSIGDRMKQLRKHKRISADTIAEKIGVSRSTIFRYEKGDIEKIPIDVVTQIADVIGVKPEELMGLKPKTLVEEISRVVNRLHEDRKRHVLDFATNQLAEQSHPQKVVPFKVPTPIHYSEVQLLGVVSAGTGEFQVDGDAQPTIRYPGHVPNYDYALRVNGDSMYPMLEDNQVIFVRHSNGSDVYAGQIIIALLNDFAFVKKIDLDEGRVRLISLNPNYDPIEVEEGDDFQIQGIVVL